MKKIIAVLLVLVLCSMTAMATEVAETEETAAAVETVETVAAEAVEEVEVEVIPVWTSDNEAVATVDQAGVITPVGIGTANITCTKGEEVTTTVYEVTEITCAYCATVITTVEEQAQHGIAAECGVEGHVTCDGKKHTTKDLDRYCPNDEDPCNACQAGEATHDCDYCGKTYACEDSGSHTECRMCGEPWCNKTNGNHKTPACGDDEHRPCVYKKDYRHTDCRHCGKPLCKPSHKNCGKVQAPAKPQAPAVSEQPSIESTDIPSYAPPTTEIPE